MFFKSRTNLIGMSAALALLLVASIASAQTLSGNSSGTEFFGNAAGSGYTPSGQVFIGAWDGSGWCAGYTNFNVNSSGTFSGSGCYVAPNTDGSCPCGHTYTVYGYDWTTATYSNGVSFLDNCPE